MAPTKLQLFDGVHWREQIALLACVQVVLVALFSVFGKLKVMNERGQMEFIEFSVLSNVLRSSIALKFTHGALIASTLPLAFDAALDLMQTGMDLDLIVRINFILVNVIPSSIYLSTNSFWYGTILYVSLNQMITIIVFGDVLVALTGIDFAPFWFNLLMFSLYCSSVIIKIYSIVADNTTGQHVAGYFSVLVFILLVCSSLRWFRALWLRYRKNAMLDKTFLIGDNETACFVHLVGILLWWISVAVSNQFTNSTYWLSSTEANIVSYVVMQYFFVIPRTILPGRLARGNRYLAEKILIQKRAYVRYVSHEIRSPMNVVSAGLELLRQEIAELNTSAPTIDELLLDITDSSETAINILNDLLHYENMDAGKFSVEMVSTHPAGCFKFRNLSVVAKRHGLNMSVLPMRTDIDMMHLCCHVDVYRMEQVLRNLFTNSCKFTPCGGAITLSSTIDLFPHRTAHVGLEPKGKLRINVVDTGVGISSASAKKLFGEFQQFDKNTLQSGGGSGLGLWICKQLVNMHNGTVGCDSEGAGKGSTFFIELPVYHSPTALTISKDRDSLLDASDFPFIPERTSPLITKLPRAPLEISADDLESGAVQLVPLTAPSQELALPTLKVLLVEDSAMNRKIVRRMLDNELSTASEVIEAEDGEEAIAIMRQTIESGSRPFDLVLLDSVMKVVHGPETAVAFREVLGFGGYLAGLTGNALPEDISSFMSKVSLFKSFFSDVFYVAHCIFHRAWTIVF